MESIVEFRKDSLIAVPKSEKYVITGRGGKRLRKTTKGFELLVRWADGNESWIKLKDMKESHPVQTAEFARSKGIDDKAAFAWWVPYTLRKRDIILCKIKGRIRRTTHKYGIEVPRNVEHAYKLDKKNGNH